MKNLTLIFLFLFAVSSTKIVYGTIINVPGDEPSIQDGINAAVDYDTVMVQPGVYIEEIYFMGKDIVVGSLYIITQDTSYISQTIIDGNDENYNLVNFMAGETPDAKLVGFTIRNGNTGYIAAPFGIGIRVQNSSPVIEYNIVEDNYCFWYIDGCGIGLNNSEAIIRNNIIRNNSGSYSGGGIFIDQSSGTRVENNIIYGNTTMSGYGVSYGGGIFVGNSEAIIIKNNLIYNNTVDFGEGGGIAFRNSSGTIRNNTITGNDIDWGSGTGIIIFEQSNAEIRNNIVWANYPLDMAQISGENFVVEYCDVQGGIEGTGNINLDPLFADTTYNNFKLTLQSPCINAGDPNTNPDPDGTNADMGYLYFDMSNYGSISGTVTLNGGSGNINNVCITDNNYTVFPDLMGQYKINLLPGIYNLTASLPGYQNVTLESIEVEQGQVTTDQDLILDLIYINHTITVNQDGTGDFLTIQEGVDTALDGDTVLVFPGTYFENVLLNKNIILASTFLIEQDTNMVNQTMIDGSGNGNALLIDENQSNFTQVNGFKILSSSNEYPCVYAYNTSFRIENCKISNINCTVGLGLDIKACNVFFINKNIFINSNYGAGILDCNDGIISENVFRNHRVGLTVSNSTIEVNNNLFTDNNWGMSVYGTYTTISRNLFLDNSTGIHGSSFSARIENNVLANEATNIYCSQLATPLIINNLIYDAHTGIKCLHASPRVINNTIVSNEEGIYITANSSSEIVNNIVWGNESSFVIPPDNEVTISYCCIEGDFPPNAIDGGGNLFTDPLFTDLSILDFHLLPNSPCINTGNPDTTGLFLPLFDLDESPEFQLVLLIWECMKFYLLGRRKILCLLIVTKLKFIQILLSMKFILIFQILRQVITN